MDDLQLLGEMRSDIGSAPAATLARGREKVMAKIGPASTFVATTDTHAKGTVSTPRFRRRVLIASAAAALLVGGIVVADVVRPSGPGATAEAAEVLNSAAAAAIQTSDPVVKPGQYLKVETKAVYASMVSRADGTTVSWLDSTGGQVYVPADMSGEWVWNREPRVPTTFFSKESRAEAQQREASKSDGGSASPQLEGILRGKAGAFYDSPQQILGTPLLEAIKTLPREPRQLLALIYEKTKGKGPSPESEALSTIASSLRTGILPADLRAAMYKAAALIPGVVVADKQATLDGRQGVALGVSWAEGKFREDIIVDPATGLMIGERTIYLVAEGGIPANTASSWTSVKTSVVNAAP